MKCASWLRGSVAMLAVALACAAVSLASATEIAGVKLDDAVQVGERNLSLNGAGVRYKVVFKVYVAGLYLPEKRSNLPDILALPGSRRIALVMLRDVESETFRRAFTEGINNNSEAAERSKIVNQMLTFGHMFAAIPEIKKGDALTIDWIPGSGTMCMLNGRKISEYIPDLAFYNALLKIWLGHNPADAALKSAMLGENP